METGATTSATLAVKVSADFARKYREFCEAHSLQLGRFTEQALAEVMEDYHFGLKAQRVLSLTSGQAVPHEKAFHRRSPRRR